MTYSHLLAQLNSSLHATMSVLLTRDKSISFPGSGVSVTEDATLTALVAQINQLSQRINEIRNKFRKGELGPDEEIDLPLFQKEE